MSMPEYRKLLGWTQRELAAALDMSLRAVQDIEAGVSKYRKVHQFACAYLAFQHLGY